MLLVILVLLIILLVICIVTIPVSMYNKGVRHRNMLKAQEKSTENAYQKRRTSSELELEEKLNKLEKRVDRLEDILLKKNN